jgi:hypothetical protein
MASSQVGTGTGAITQQGNVGTGDYKVDNSEGKTLGNITGGEIKNLASGSSATSLQVSSGEGAIGAITVNQESPQAIQALQAISGYSLRTMSDTALGSLGIAHQVAEDALKTALQATESPTQSIGKILIPLALIAGIIGAVYLYKKG